MDDGTVEGAPEGAVRSIERNVVNAANDPNPFNVVPALETGRLAAPDASHPWLALDGPNRVSARDVIVRELVSNSLVHREFSSPYIARITIDAREISTRNASGSLYSGPVTLDNLDPTPKNPVISGFFAQMGRAEELGSGTRSLYKYSRLYTGLDPELADGDFFTAFVPAPDVLGAAPPSHGA